MFPNSWVCSVADCCATGCLYVIGADRVWSLAGFTERITNKVDLFLIAVWFSALFLALPLTGLNETICSVRTVSWPQQLQFLWFLFQRCITDFPKIFQCFLMAVVPATQQTGDYTRSVSASGEWYGNSDVMHIVYSFCSASNKWYHRF